MVKKKKPDLQAKCVSLSYLMVNDQDPQSCLSSTAILYQLMKNVMSLVSYNYKVLLGVCGRLKHY